MTPPMNTSLKNMKYKIEKYCDGVTTIVFIPEIQQLSALFFLVGEEERIPEFMTFLQQEQSLLSFFPAVGSQVKKTMMS